MQFESCWKLFKFSSTTVSTSTMLTTTNFQALVTLFSRAFWNFLLLKKEKHMVYMLDCCCRPAPEDKKGNILIWFLNTFSEMPPVTNCKIKAVSALESWKSGWSKDGNVCCGLVTFLTYKLYCNTIPYAGFWRGGFENHTLLSIPP